VPFWGAEGHADRREPWRPRRTAGSEAAPDLLEDLDHRRDRRRACAPAEVRRLIPRSVDPLRVIDGLDRQADGGTDVASTKET
jgi:hypothetical protein